MSARRRLAAAVSAHCIAFRVTADERAALVLEARERGLDVSGLVRLVVAELLARRGARRQRRARADGPPAAPTPADALAGPRRSGPAPVVEAPTVVEAPAAPPPAPVAAPELLEHAVAVEAPEPALVDPLGELLATVRAAAAPGLEVPLVVVVALVGDEAEASAGLAELAARGDVVLEGDLVRVARP